MGVPLHPPGTKFDYPDTMAPWPEEGYDPLPKPALTVTWSKENVPEQVAMIFDALHKFDIRPKENKYPLLKVLVDYFESRTFSTGERVSHHKAEFLASACRPVDAKKGGNKKKG
jgi:hypothetical protein